MIQLGFISSALFDFRLKTTGTGKLEIKSNGEIDGEKVDIEFTADLSDEETNKVKSSR